MRASRNRNGARQQWGLVSGVFGLLALLSGFVVIDALRPLGSEALAQQHVHSAHQIDQSTAPLVDGSKEPGLVPDDVAIRALMQTLRVPIDPEAADLKQLRTRLDRVSLISADMQVLVRELGMFDALAQEQEARIEAIRPQSSLPVESAAVARYLDEQTKLRLLMVEHYEQLLASLSPAGEVEMREHLSHIKSRIKIYPKPDMLAGIE